MTRPAIASVVNSAPSAALRASVETRQLVARKVPRPLGIGALQLDLVRVTVGLEQPQYAIDMR